MSWKDFSELAPQLTQGEIRFERIKRTIGFFLGPLIFVLVLSSPTLEHVSPIGMRSLAVFAWAVIWWVTEAIPIPATAVLIFPLIVVCGIWPYPKAFGYWSHWAVMFLIGAFIIGHAMQVHGLTRRFGLALISSRLVGGKPWRLLVFYLAGVVIVTAFMSNVVTTVLFLSIGFGLLEALKIKPGSRYAMALFLGIAWAANIGGVITPAGSPTNLIAIGLVERIDYHIGYLQWVLASLPFALLQLMFMFLLLRLFLPREELKREISQVSILEEYRHLGPFSRGEKYATAALVVAVVLWAMPDMSPVLLGASHPAAVWMRDHMNWGATSLLVAVSLFVLPLDWTKRKFAMTWGEAANNIEWGTVALVGGALAVGDMIGDKEVGLGEFFSYGVQSLAGPDTSRYWFLLVTILLAVILTQVATTVAVISFMGPIAVAVGPALGLNPIALTAVVSYAATLGYAFPMANPPCAIVFASGHVRILPMFLWGSLLAIIGSLLLSFVGYPVLNWVFPWSPG
ncbi:MAG: SLC13 family permease [Acidobacteria bacterium]|nr:SLC13 family permease [Acidobacteriota bacterium]